MGRLPECIQAAYAGVTQLVECVLPKHDVAGSNPVACSIFLLYRQTVGLVLQGLEYWCWTACVRACLDVLGGGGTLHCLLQRHRSAVYNAPMISSK